MKKIKDHKSLIKNHVWKKKHFTMSGKSWYNTWQPVIVSSNIECKLTICKNIQDKNDELISKSVENPREYYIKICIRKYDSQKRITKLTISAWVLQDSALGPIMWNIMLNNILQLEFQIEQQLLDWPNIAVIVTASKEIELLPR